MIRLEYDLIKSKSCGVNLHPVKHIEGMGFVIDSCNTITIQKVVMGVRYYTDSTIENLPEYINIIN